MIEKIKNIKMTWLKVIIMAITFGAVTAFILLTPSLENTSIHNIGVCFEFWFIPAVLIGINCKKPLEAALKVFVFFLISQPLIYLIQIPFGAMTMADFGGYYRRWLVWTLLMLPGGVAVWLGTKKSWIGVLDAVVASAFLFFFEFSPHLSSLIKHGFPHQLLACILILIEVVLIILIYTKEPKLRIIAFICAVLFCLVGLFYQKATLSKASPANYNLGQGEYTVSYCDDGVEASVENGQLTVFAESEGTYTVTVKNSNGEERNFNCTLKDGFIDLVEAE